MSVEYTICEYISYDAMTINQYTHMLYIFLIKQLHINMKTCPEIVIKHLKVLFFVNKCLYMVYKIPIVIFVYKIHKTHTSRQRWHFKDISLPRTWSSTAIVNIFIWDLWHEYPHNFSLFIGILKKTAWANIYSSGLKATLKEESNEGIV